MMKNNMLSNKFRPRKAQMELMGLMIVVILLIIGVLFAVKFVVLKEPDTTRATFTRTQLASNLGMSMLESSTASCRGTAIKDLLMDCGGRPGGTITCPPSGLSSCVYVNKTLVNMLNETLVEWNTKFEAKAYVHKGSNIFYFNNLDCTDRKPGESESFFLPTDSGLLKFQIYICE